MAGDSLTRGVILKLLFLFCFVTLCRTHAGPNSELVNVLELSQTGKVYPRGSYGYEKRRIVHNGLCSHIYPDVIVVPYTTEDVSSIVKIARAYDQVISVRSGGHSFTCTSLKQGGINIDMRTMNKVNIISPHLVELGPGSTWDRVLKLVPPSHYTVIHGQCKSVGIGGYILGGGINVVGTSEKYGTAGDHVIKYTMVDAVGNILHVTRDNTTVIFPETGETQMLYDDHNLFFSLTGAGQSYGIVTEFLYKIYPKPETLPILAMIFLENPYDVRKLERLAMDGRYHVTLFFIYMFKDLQRVPELSRNYVGFKVIPRLLMSAARRKAEPVFVSMVDNNKRTGRHTQRKGAIALLRRYGIKVAYDEVVSRILPTMLDLDDYESEYMSYAEKKQRGNQAVYSANLMNLRNLKPLEYIIFEHQVFSFFNKNKPSVKKAGCEYCYLVVPSTVKESFLPLTDVGKFQIELTCSYPPNANVACPHVLRDIKEELVKRALYQGDTPTQYLNTPTCDYRGDFGNRYWGTKNYPPLLESKQYWDPDNVFHFCQSVGSNDESCCPQVQKYGNGYGK